MNRNTFKWNVRDFVQYKRRAKKHKKGEKVFEYHNANVRREERAR